MNNPATAAIIFALEHGASGMDFLSYWNEGEFDTCRREWPEAPKECYIGADPLMPETMAQLAQESEDDLLRAMLAHAWSISFKYNRDGSIRRMVIDVRDTVTMAPDIVDSTAQRVAEFVKTAPGCGL